MRLHRRFEASSASWGALSIFFAFLFENGDAAIERLVKVAFLFVEGLFDAFAVV